MAVLFAQWIAVLARDHWAWVGFLLAPLDVYHRLGNVLVRLRAIGRQL